MCEGPFSQYRYFNFISNPQYFFHLQPFMENLEISKVEKKQAATGATGFNIFDEDDSYSEGLDECEYDHIEVDYVEKLRTQRQRMEKLEKCYWEKQQQLGKEVERTNELLEEVEKMAMYLPYKQKYEDLKQDYSDLLSRYNLQQSELQDVKSQLATVINENSCIISQLKGQLKVLKETSNLNANQLQQAISDRDEDIRKLKRERREKEDQLLEEIKSLKGCVNKLKSEMEDEAITYDREKDNLNSEIKNRDCALADLEKALENAKRVNLDLKNDMLRYNEEVNSRERQLNNLCSKYKHQLNQTKKTVSEKEYKIEDLESLVKKSQNMSHQLKEDLDNLKIDYKKTCELYESNIKKMKNQSDSQITRLEAFVRELKDSIEELMQLKNQLVTQNRRLVGILKKKEQIQRQRKHLLISEFKEIDRIQKVIDRLQ